MAHLSNKSPTTYLGIWGDYSTHHRILCSKADWPSLVSWSTTTDSSSKPYREVTSLPHLYKNTRACHTCFHDHLMLEIPLVSKHLGKTFKYCAPHAWNTLQSLKIWYLLCNLSTTKKEDLNPQCVFQDIHKGQMKIKGKKNYIFRETSLSLQPVYVSVIFINLHNKWNDMYQHSLLQD